MLCDSWFISRRARVRSRPAVLPRPSQLFTGKRALAELERKPHSSYYVSVPPLVFLMVSLLVCVMVSSWGFLARFSAYFTLVSLIWFLLDFLLVPLVVSPVFPVVILLALSMLSLFSLCLFTVCHWFLSSLPPCCILIM